MVVFLQNLLGPREVDLVLGPLAPRQLGHPFQKSPDHLVLGRLRASALQTVQLALDLRALFVGEVDRPDPLLDLLYVVAVLPLPELLLDLLELLAQQHLTLPLPQLGLDPGLDVFLCIDAGELALHRNQGTAHPLFVVECLEELLLVLGGELEVEGHQVSEGAGIVDALDELIERFSRHSPPGAELSSPVAELPVQRLERRILIRARALALHLEKDGAEHVLALLLIVHRLGASLALNEQLHATPHPVRLDDANHRADVVQNLRVGLVYVLPLGNREKSTISVQGFLYGLHRSDALGRYRYGDSGIDHRVPKRKDRQCITLAHGTLVR